MESLDWTELFGFSVSPWELVVRGSVMYWFLFLLFRFIIRRNVGAVGIADILLLVIVADASQNAFSGEYRSIADGIVLVGVLIGWNYFLDWVNFRWPAFRRFAQPPPLLLVHNGELMRRNLRAERITEEELQAKLREQGVASIDAVKSAYMESDGQVSVIKRSR